MPRPFPWLPRVSKIRATVANSVRSHYTRRELELVFGVSPRAAGRLLALLATEPMADAHVVSRDVLGDFLRDVSETDDVPALCDRIRASRQNLTRVKARYLVTRDLPEAQLASLPECLKVEPGEIRIRAGTLEQLLESLVLLGQVMADDPVGFQLRFEVAAKTDESAEAADARYIRAEIERMEADHNRLIR